VIEVLKVVGLVLGGREGKEELEREDIDWW
jgi:hypothetical protein